MQVSVQIYIYHDGSTPFMSIPKPRIALDSSWPHVLFLGPFLDASFYPSLGVYLKTIAPWQFAQLDAPRP